MREQQLLQLSPRLQLRHLFVSERKVEFRRTVIGCVPTFEEAWQWKNLQTLRSVNATMKLVQQLEDMKELRSLKVLEVEQAHCPQLCTSLNTMRKLRCLRLFARREEQLDFETLNSPLPLLQKLKLWGRLFEGKFPRFICSCAELTHVELGRTELIEDPLPSLGQLPKLVKLDLFYDAFVGQKLHFRTGWFLDLKMLYMRRLKNLNDIVTEEGAMTNLHELVMFDLSELKMVPPGIQFLTHLKDIHLNNMPNELVEKLRKDDDNEDLPRIHIFFYDRQYFDLL